jgi:phosphoglycolate phosphatase-like HAD superfamily hydrolase
MRVIFDVDGTLIQSAAVDAELYDRADGRRAEMQRRFVALLASVDAIEPVAGARSIVSALQTRDIAVAVATGGWRAAAIHKLRAARVDLGSAPLVGSDESPRRRDIIARAIALAGGDGDVFYVGDGAWDLEASRALGIGFVAVDTNRRLGVPAVADFSDVEAFVRMLRR